MGKGRKNPTKKGNFNAINANHSLSDSSDDGLIAKDEEIRFLRDELLTLKARVTKLENQVIILKSEQAIVSTVNSRLVDEIDNLESYSRRNCLVIRNVPVVENESPHDIEEKVKQVFSSAGITRDVINDIDKLHPIGGIKGNKRKVIVRFNSHSKRYDLYRNKKKLPSDIRVSPSLTKRRQKKLSEAIDMVSSIDSVAFVFADIHGDLKVRLNEADKNGRYVLKFNSTEHLAEIIRGLDFSTIDVGSERCSDSDSEI